MNNFYMHNGWPHTNAGNPSQQVPNTMNRLHANRRIDLDHQTASTVFLREGFKRYYWDWDYGVRIKGNEYVDIRLIGEENHVLISAGFSIDNRSQVALVKNIYAVQTTPIFQHIMAITLHSAEPVNDESLVGMWLLVKELK
ncbi:hypothetical protein [Peribacillus sp. FSL R5-0717]|uniref:hypothetical protein n=1 Tax=Peribacillus sp. FSL R5-0717 TaxID=2975308 RepID=UPI0030F8A32E